MQSCLTVLLTYNTLTRCLEYFTMWTLVSLAQRWRLCLEYAKYTTKMNAPLLQECILTKKETIFLQNAQTNTNKF